MSLATSESLDHSDLEQLANLPFGKLVSLLRALFDLSQKELSEVLGVNERTVGRWEQDSTQTPHGQNRRAIDALKTIAEALGDLFEPEIIKIWVNKPNPALNGERPRDYARKPGGLYRISALLGTNGR